MKAYLSGFFGAIGVGLAVLLMFELSDIFTPKDSSDPIFGRSGMSVLTDYKTGLQYLKAGAAITPRIDKNGKQMRGNS